VATSALDAIIKNNHHSVRVQVKPLFSKQYFSIDVKGIMALSPANIILGYILYQKNKEAVKKYASN
jgi:hypothetical protein